MAAAFGLPLGAGPEGDEGDEDPVPVVGPEGDEGAAKPATQVARDEHNEEKAELSPAQVVALDMAAVSIVGQMPTSEE